MKDFNQILAEVLEKRKSENRFRSLRHDRQQIDFCSNDYLGLAQSEALKKDIEKELQKHPEYKNGSTGSRLLAGNTQYAQELEQWIADFHHAEAGLIFNSGYDANVGLLSCIGQRRDTIYYDELSHASIIDGIRLSQCTSYKFQHNNLNDLENKLNGTNGNIFIVAESVYSMDGDFVPLVELVNIAEKYNAALIIDEAHATGIYGEHGRGKVCEERLESKVFARVHTFGKALGVHGAIVVGSKILRDYLINYARPFIYSTALPFHSLVSIRCTYEVIKSSGMEREQLNKNINYYRANQSLNRVGESGFNSSPIQSIIIPGNENVKTVANRLQENGFDIRPILSPTVPKGKERLRICIHSFNSEEELNKLIKLIKSVEELIEKPIHQPI